MVLFRETFDIPFRQKTIIRSVISWIRSWEWPESLIRVVKKSDIVFDTFSVGFFSFRVSISSKQSCLILRKTAFIPTSQNFRFVWCFYWHLLHPSYCVMRVLYVAFSLASRLPSLRSFMGVNKAVGRSSAAISKSFELMLNALCVPWSELFSQPLEKCDVRSEISEELSVMQAKSSHWLFKSLDTSMAFFLSQRNWKHLGF